MLHTKGNQNKPGVALLIPEKTDFKIKSLIKDKDELVLSYLSDIYNTIVKKDILDRNNIKDTALLENIIKYLANNIGSPVSSNKISDYLKSNKIWTHLSSIMKADIEYYSIFPLEVINAFENLIV